MSEDSESWKKPEDVMKLHRLKRKKKALQERMKQPSSQNNLEKATIFRKCDSSLSLTKLFGGEKRKNPFNKNTENNKKFCDSIDYNNSTLDESSDSTLFELLSLTNSNLGAVKQLPSNERLSSFQNLLNKITKEQQVFDNFQPTTCTSKRKIPIDWSLKVKVRFMSPKPFAWNQKLKASEEASGITSFVRCLDTTSSCTLDTSQHARFHQNCLYWQHPSLPWITLFPRTSGRVSTKSFIVTNEEIKEALHKEWTESFRSLFQLVRARQCPYFYVCANNFTCLFQAAGIGGQQETCAYLTPSTRGLRQTLKQEEIEYAMPLRKNYAKRKSGETNADLSEEKGNGDAPKNSSFDSCYDTMDNTNGQSPLAPPANGGDAPSDNKDKEEGSGDEDDLESEQWLQSLGVAEDEIKKINYSQIRKNQATESMVDSGEESLIFVHGVDAQALFNFLLNCKSSIPATGPFGGIPPTLLAPSAFQGGTLQPLKVRESVVHSEGGKYYSVELRGPVLPSTVHSLCSLLQAGANPYSGTFANIQHSSAFTKAARIMADGDKTTENSSNKMPSVFGKENLSDCGLNQEILESFCSPDPSTMETIDSLSYSEEKNAYTW